MSQNIAHGSANGPINSEDPKYSTSMSYAAITSQFSHLEGKVLTVVDAAISLDSQRKAIKDLIRGHFRGQLRHIESVLSSKSGGLCLEASGNPHADSN